jgi:hypothetical protein
MVPVAPIITGITFVFKFHMRCICTVGSLRFKIFRLLSLSLIIIIIIISSSSSSSSSGCIYAGFVFVILQVLLSQHVNKQLLRCI